MWNMVAVGEKEHQPVGDAAPGAFVERTEKSTLDGDDFVDLGANAIIAELEPERYAYTWAMQVPESAHEMLLHSNKAC